MRLNILSVLLIVLAVSVHAEDQMTIRIKPAPFPEPNGCTSTTGNPHAGWGSAEDPTRTVYEFLGPGWGCVGFTDPLAAGSKVTELDLKISYAPTTSPEMVDYYQVSPDMGHWDAWPLIGTFTTAVGTYFQGPDAGPRDQMQIAQLTGPHVADGLPGYVYGGRNDVSIKTLNFNLNVEFIDITIRYEPPPIIDFDLNGQASADDRKLLIHRWRDEADYPYPSRFQRNLPGNGNADRDRKIEITGTARTASNSPVANKTIYLRVTDPADTSLYVPPAQRRVGDNAVWLGGVLGDTSATTDNNGRFRTVLTGSEAAGDNYRVEASSIAGFGFSSACDVTNNCFQSAVITNWKRVYVEHDRMFRAGSMVRTAAPAGQNRVEVVPYHQKLTRGHRVYLIHAPMIGEPPTNYYMEEAVITDAVRNRSTDSATLSLDRNLAHPYFPAQSSPELADAVGLVTGDDPADFYNVGNSYFPALFGDAFVDYRVLQPRDNPVPFVPYMQTTTRSDALADRWFFNRTFPPVGPSTAAANHEHLLAGSQTASIGTLGSTGVNAGTNYSWIWVDRVEGFGGASASEWRKLGEVTAHELGHQWHTNRDKSATFGSEHCDPLTQYSSKTLFCTMHSNADGTEFSDGRVEFHYVVTGGNVDSEYIFIRQRAEPVPQYP